MTSSMGGGSGYSGSKNNTGSIARGGSTGDIIPKGFRKGQINQYTPEQQRVFGEWGDEMGPDSYLSRLAGGDESLFEQMEAPAHRQFQGQLGQIASRFSGAGTGGRHSSGFQNATTAAASNFSQDLQAQRMNLQRQAMQDLRGMRESFLNQQPYDRFLTEKQQKQNPWGDIAGQFAGAIPGAVSSFFNPLSGVSNALNQQTMHRGY